MEYRFVDPVFDEDCSSVQLYVRYHNETNIVKMNNLVVELYQHYRWKALDYFSRCKKCSESLEIQKYFNKKMNKIHDFHLHMVTTKNFENKNLLVIGFLKLFAKMSNWLCDGEKLFRAEKKIIKTGNLYPIANNTGHFGYNSYLYSFINGIHLVGVPSGISDYDGTSGCSNVFLEHDFIHTFSVMNGNKSWKKDIPKIYESIFDSILSLEIKKICLFTLFFYVHEVYQNTYPFDNDKFAFAFFDAQKINYEEVNYGINPSPSVYRQVIRNFSGLKMEDNVVYGPISELLSSLEEKEYGDLNLYEKNSIILLHGLWTISLIYIRN